MFCSLALKGSPGRSVEVTSKWLLQVNGKPVKSIDDVLAIATTVHDRDYVRLTMQDVFCGTSQVCWLAVPLLLGILLVSDWGVSRRVSRCVLI